MSAAVMESRAPKSTKSRIDQLLVDRGLADSREKAHALILAGQVLVNGQKAVKPGHNVPRDSEISVAERMPYVSRGGYKLAAALDHWAIDPAGRICIDVGASTGGFTDCLLQHGAARVVCVDSGTNQLDWRLRNDFRVDVRERTNARALRPAEFDSLFGIIVMDVSFISVTKIIPALIPILVERGRMIILIKPQFEVGKGEVGKGGVVRDAVKQQRVIDEVNRFAGSAGLRVGGVVESPILGAEGNREFLALYERA